MELARNVKTSLFKYQCFLIFIHFRNNNNETEILSRNNNKKQTFLYQKKLAKICSSSIKMPMFRNLYSFQEQRQNYFLKIYQLTHQLPSILR
jgi:hypothetical protein